MRLEIIKAMVETLNKVSEITETDYEGESTEVLIIALDELLNVYNHLKEEYKKLKENQIFNEKVEYEYGE